jgi:sulfur-carrier protein
MIVYIPSPLRSYTNNESRIDIESQNLFDLSMALEKKYPGIRFRMIDEQDRIREHIKVFVNSEVVKDLKNCPLQNGDVVHITCALSGG